MVEIDGSTLNTPTAGYICAKVRRFGDRVYGEARLQYPAVRTGPKGLARFRRIGWDEALERTVAVRIYAIDLTPPELTPSAIRAIRESLGLSQALFAVSVLRTTPRPKAATVPSAWRPFPGRSPEYGVPSGPGPRE